MAIVMQGPPASERVDGGFGNSSGNITHAYTIGISIAPSIFAGGGAGAATAHLWGNWNG